MTDTAKRVVESTNVPQAISLLKGRVEITEERLANMANKSFRSLEEELVGLRSEVRGVLPRPQTGQSYLDWMKNACLTIRTNSMNLAERMLIIFFTRQCAASKSITQKYFWK